MTPSEMPKHTRPVVPFLAGWWNKCMEITYGAVPKPLTPKELGQLKLLRNSIEEVTPAVIGWVIKNWELFCRKAMSEAGLSTAPPKPHIGFLLAHHSAAIHLMH